MNDILVQVRSPDPVSVVKAVGGDGDDGDVAGDALQLPRLDRVEVRQPHEEVPLARGPSAALEDTVCVRYVRPLLKQ